MKMQMLIVCLFIGTALSMPGQHPHHEEKEEEEGQFFIIFSYFWDFCVHLDICYLVGFAAAIRARDWW